MQSWAIDNPYVDVREHVLRAIMKMKRIVKLCESAMDGLLNGPSGHPPQCPRGQGAPWPESLVMFNVNDLRTATSTQTLL